MSNRLDGRRRSICTGDDLPAANAAQKRARLRKRSFRKPLRAFRRRGATTVEFAFVAPFLFLFMLGSIEFARMVMVKQCLTNASREGCRWATLATTTDPQEVEDEIRHRLKGTLAGYANVNDVRVTVTPTQLNQLASGTNITTTVEVDCADVTWMPSLFLADIVLDASSTMERE